MLDNTKKKIILFLYKILKKISNSPIKLQVPGNPKLAKHANKKKKKKMALF